MFSTFFSDLEPWMQTATALALLCALAYTLRGVVQWVLRLLVQRWSQHVHVGWAQVLMHEKLLRRLARITPSLVIQTGIGAVPHLPAAYTTGIYNVAIAVTVYHLIQLLAAFLDALNESREIASDSQAAQHRSIKNYVQLGKLLAFLLGGILIVAILLNRSPLLLLSGLGAMSAVLMLVFKDTILSFTAGVQLSSNDMLRMGDWIEMPQVGADGAVIDIALHTVKVQNWDKTITTIPTWRLMSDSYRNWRGMSESGGRRIKRTLRIDGASIGFLDEAQLSRLQRIGLLAPYLAQKRDEIAQDNATRFQQLGSDAKEAANRRQLTNIGTFRAYVDVYLRAHPGIHQDMLLMARTLEPSPEGVPLELYCFTATTAWVQYERIQGDIFDHLLAILPEFGLRLFQSPSGHDIVQGLHSRPGAPDPRLATATPN